MIIAVDFDGTCVEHAFPNVGLDVPGAELWLKRFIGANAKIILWTMRSDDVSRGRKVLSDAIQWFADRNIPLFGINQNPEQYKWTNSPKAYAQIYIDDAAAGCPLIPSTTSNRPMVNWSVIGPMIMNNLVPTNLTNL